MSSTYRTTLDRLLKDPYYGYRSYSALSDIARREADRIDSQAYLYYAGRPQAFVTGIPKPAPVLDYAAFVAALSKPVAPKPNTTLKVGDLVEVVEPRGNLYLGQRAKIASIATKENNGDTAFITLKTPLYGDSIASGEQFYAHRVKKYVKPVVLNTTDLKVGDLVEVTNSSYLGNGNRYLIAEVTQPTVAGVKALVKIVTLAKGVDATGYGEKFYADRFKKVDHLKAEVGGKIRAVASVGGFVKGQAYTVVSVQASGTITAKGIHGPSALYKSEFVVIEGKPQPRLVKEIPVGSIIFGGDGGALDALPNGSVIVNVTSNGSQSPIVKANGDWHMIYTDGKGKVGVNHFVSDIRRKFSLVHYGTTDKGARTTRSH